MRKPLSVPTLAAVLVLPLTAAAEAAVHHVILWKATGAARLVVKLNDATVVEKKTSGSGSSGQMDVSDWAAPGDNTLSVRVEALDPKAKPKKGAEPMEFNVRLVPVAAGEFPEDDAAVAKVIWADLPKGEQKLPLEKTVTAQLKAPSTRFWKEAQAVALDDEAKRQVSALTMSIYDAMKAGDAAKVFDLNTFKLDDQSAYRGKAPKKEEFVGGFGAMLKQVKLAPLVAADLSFAAVAGGRAVSIRHKDGTQAIKGADASGFSMELYAGKIGGQWVIVR